MRPHRNGQWDESVYRLFSKIRDTMPPSGTVETLSDELKIDVVAYLLQINGFPPGDEALTSASEELEQMFIAPKGAGGAQAVTNFSLVHVSGCLTPGGEGTWWLMNASEPVPARESDQRVARSAGQPQRGALAFELQSIRRFDPGARQNHRTGVTGLLYLAPGDNSLNVTSLETFGPCQ